MFTSSAKFRSAIAWAVGWLALVLSLHAVAQPATTEAPDVQQRSADWWTAFGEAPLNLLMLRACHGDDDGSTQASEEEVSFHYIKARTSAARLQIAWQLQEVAQQLLGTWDAGDPAASSEVDDARRLLEEARQRAAAFEQARADGLRDLSRALGGGLSVARLEQVLEPALRDRRVPVPLIAVPERVSGLALRRRLDVAGAERLLADEARGLASQQLRLAQYLQAIASDIGPVQPGLSQPRATSAMLRPEQVLESARRDVGERLWQLESTVAAARRQGAYLQDLGASLSQPVARSEDLGRAGLAGIATLLVEEDRLAAASAAASLAWIALQASIGAAGATRTADLIASPAGGMTRCGKIAPHAPDPAT